MIPRPPWSIEVVQSGMGFIEDGPGFNPEKQEVPRGHLQVTGHKARGPMTAYTHHDENEKEEETYWK